MPTFETVSDADRAEFRRQLIYARLSKRAVNSRFRVGDRVTLDGAGADVGPLLVWDARADSREPEGYTLVLATPGFSHTVECVRPSDVWSIPYEEPSDTEAGQRAWARVTFGATMLGYKHPAALAWLADYYAGGWVFACGSSVWCMPHGIDEYRKLCAEHGYSVPVDMAGDLLPARLPDVHAGIFRAAAYAAMIPAGAE